MDLRFYLAVPATGWTHPCALCGKQIQDGNDCVEVGTKFENVNGNSFLFRRVSHQQCHIKYLDEGEET